MDLKTNKLMELLEMMSVHAQRQPGLQTTPPATKWLRESQTMVGESKCCLGNWYPTQTQGSLNILTGVSKDSSYLHIQITANVEKFLFNASRPTAWAKTMSNVL